MENNDETFTISGPEVAKMFGISRTTLWRWVKQGKIPCIYLSKKRPIFTKAAIMLSLKDRENLSRRARK